MTVAKEILENSPNIVNTITGTGISESLDKITQKVQALKATFHDLEQGSLDVITQFKQDIARFSNQAIKSLKTNLTETTHNLTDLSEKINISFGNFLDNWIQENPLLPWLFINPILGIIIIVVSLLLIFYLWQITLKIIKPIIIFILRTPWLISKFFLLKSFNQLLPNNKYNEQHHINTLEKLDAIERKQQAILEQLSNFNLK